MAISGWPNRESQVFNWIAKENPEAVSNLPKHTVWEMFPEYLEVGPRPKALEQLIEEMKLLGDKGESDEFVELLDLIPLDRKLSFVLLNGKQIPRDWSQDYLRRAVKGELYPVLDSYAEMHQMMAHKAGKNVGYRNDYRALEISTILYIVAVNPELNDGHLSPFLMEQLTKAYKAFSVSLTK